MRRDVVPCITSLRHLDSAHGNITEYVFNKHFRLAGLKCWLIRTDREPRRSLRDYLASFPVGEYQTATCLSRDHWWKFAMPETPPILVATGFRGERPKIVINDVNARAVGSVAGIYGVPQTKRHSFVRAFQSLELSDRIVPHSNGLKKLEIHQINAILDELSGNVSGS